MAIISKHSLLEGWQWSAHAWQCLWSTAGSSPEERRFPFCSPPRCLAAPWSAPLRSPAGEQRVMTESFHFDSALTSMLHNCQSKASVRFCLRKAEGLQNGESSKISLLSNYKLSQSNFECSTKMQQGTFIINSVILIALYSSFLYQNKAGIFACL